MPNNANGGLALPSEMLATVERFAVYRCYSDSGQLLYIGETGRVGRRLGDHIQKAWFTEVRGMTFEWYADELDALNAERRAIHVEHPKYNVVHRNTATLAPALRRPRRKAAVAPKTSLPAKEARAKARKILEREPDITGRELGELCGMGERWGQFRKQEFAAERP